MVLERVEGSVTGANIADDHAGAKQGENHDRHKEEDVAAINHPALESREVGQHAEGADQVYRTLRKDG